MIKALRLKNFKCFKNSEFELRKLNILCGQNNVGKSSLIQSLLLMKIASEKIMGEKVVKLNGPFDLELGQVMDVCYNNAEDEFIEFFLKTIDKNEYIWKFPVDSSVADNPFLKIESEPSKYPTFFVSESSFYFTFLSAERFGPRNVQIIQSLPKQMMRIGTKGEFVAEVLNGCERDKVRNELLHPSTQYKKEVNDKLGKQVELWMQDLISGVQIRSNTYQDTNIASIRVKKEGKNSEWHKPTNAGFGISYSLPIIVAGLLSPAGSLFIVDSPESHLHPSAQAKMIRFLATLAAGNIQVIIETHSDHILNGARLAAIDEHPINREDIIIHNFYYEAEQESEECFKNIALDITQTGSLSSWPQGFLDQTERDLYNILKAREKNEK